MTPFLQTLPILLATCGGCETGSDGAAPPRWTDSPHRPLTLSLSGDQRTRHEHLSNQFRAGLDGVAQALVFRTRVSAELDFRHFRLRAELQDSRAEHAAGRTHHHGYRQPAPGLPQSIPQHLGRLHRHRVAVDRSGQQHGATRERPVIMT